MSYDGGVTDSIGQILVLAAGVALSPFPIVGIVLVLATERARSNAPAYLLGWFTGILAVGAIVLAVSNGADAHGSPTGSAWLKIGLGVLLLSVAARKWRSRPAAGEEEPLPGWMRKVEEFDALRSLALGFALSAVNPKTLVLIAGAAATIAESGESTSDQLVSLVVFALLGSIGVLVPLAMFFLMGDRARLRLDAIRHWMAANNTVIVVVICLLIAAKLIGDGITALG